MYYLLYEDILADAFDIRDTSDNTTQRISLNNLELLCNNGVDIHGVASKPFDAWDNCQVSENLYVSPSVGRSAVLAKLAVMHNFSVDRLEFDYSGRLIFAGVEKDAYLYFDLVCSVVHFDARFAYTDNTYRKKIGAGVLEWSVELGYTEKTRNTYFQYRNMDISEATPKVYKCLVDKILKDEERGKTCNLGDRGLKYRMKFTLKHGVDALNGVQCFEDRDLEREFLKVNKASMLINLERYGIKRKDLQYWFQQRLWLLKNYDTYEKFLALIRKTDTQFSKFNNRFSYFKGVTVVNSLGKNVSNGFGYVWIYFLLGGRDREIYENFVEAMKDMYIID